jgi:hypothetical protein
MKIDVYKSSKASGRLTKVVMVPTGAGVPAAVQCKGEVWAFDRALNATGRADKWMQDVVNDIQQHGHAVRRVGVVVDVIDQVPPEVQAKLEKRLTRR